MDDRLKNKIESFDELREIMSSVELEHLGDGQVAYVRPVELELAYKLFPSLSGVPDGVALYSLHAADGTPIVLTDSRDAAVADAHEHDLELLSVH